MKSAADAVSGVGGGLGEQDDPEFVKLAAPFGLTTMEALAKSLPKHRPLRLTLASGFTQWAYAFIQQDADRLEEQDIGQARVGFERAKHFYLRARDYALDGLDLAHAGVKKILLTTDQAAWDKKLGEMKKEDVPYLYWCAASWALAISTAKDDPAYIGDVGLVNKIMNRALALDEAWQDGVIHEFYVSAGIAFARVDQIRDAIEQAKLHKDRALQLSQRAHLSALVAYAESVLIPSQGVATLEIAEIKDPQAKQDAMNQRNKELHEEFLATLQEVLNTNIYFDQPKWKENRLANVIAQNRAKWLLNRHAELFVN